MRKAALISLALGACITQATLAPAQTKGDAAALFGSKCAVCHGAKGDASTEIGRNMKLRDLRSPDVQKSTDEQLMTIVRCGKGKMPGYEKRLTGDQIAVLVEYMRTLAGGKQR